MTGIVNSTGARSGVIGTTVGTPVTDLSTATFPAGHVINTTYQSWSGLSSDGTTSLDLARTTPEGRFRGIIPNVLASSHVHITMSMFISSSNPGPAGGEDPGYETGVRLGIYADTDGAGANERIVYDTGENSGWAFRNWADQSGSIYTVFRMLPVIHAIDIAPATGTNYYMLGIGVRNTGSGLNVQTSTNYAPFICTLMEIAQ